MSGEGFGKLHKQRAKQEAKEAKRAAKAVVACVCTDCGQQSKRRRKYLDAPCAACGGVVAEN